MDTLTGRVARRFKQGASEIKISDIPKDLQPFVKKLERRFGKAFTAWNGVHGVIVDFQASGVQVNRLTKDDLKMLVSNSSFRWIQAEKDEVSVGM